MPPVKPMLAKAIHELPAGETGDFYFEPKWDGFRALIFRDGDDVEIGSRNQKPFSRYFPELPEHLRASLPNRCVVDGELIVVTERGLDFGALGQRIHPAESRVGMLAEKTPASFVAFDLLALDNNDLTELPFSERRKALEGIAGAFAPPIYLTPTTIDRDLAGDWFARFRGGGFDGLMAKAADGVYLPDKRSQLKVKHKQTADCVVAGYRMHKSGDGVGSMLLGCFDDNEQLRHLGVASSFKAADRPLLLEKLSELHMDDFGEHPWSHWAEQDQHSDGSMPGGPNRWNSTKDMTWVPVHPRLVAEVRFEHASDGRFRGVSRLSRWRPDREPQTCHVSQLNEEPPIELHTLFGVGQPES